MMKFITIMLVMGISQRKNVTDYWSTDPALVHTLIGNITPLRRFQILSAMIQLTSRKSANKGQPGYDPWMKWEILLDGESSPIYTKGGDEPSRKSKMSRQRIPCLYDNFYTKVPLAEVLFARKTFLTGT
ncbi:hypothetical protein J6590_069795 [Homalodisca vitripennis]|nr:hypothetical protein J6590_069795 [Homalodisca vitripennis]